MEAPRVHLQDRGIGKSTDDTELRWLKSSRHSLTQAFFLTDPRLKLKRANGDGNILKRGKIIRFVFADLV